MISCLYRSFIISFLYCSFIISYTQTTHESRSCAAALPTVSNVHVKKLSSTVYYGDGEYFGGFEGPSLFSWYRENADGAIMLIDGANSKSYEVDDSDYNCHLLFG